MNMANESQFPTAATATPTSTVILPNASTFRFPNPPFYEGARDGFKCDAWLTAVQRFFVGAKIATEERTLHAIIFLTGTASLWWESHPLTDDAPWSAFVEAFRTEFRPVGFLDSIRSLLYSITFTSTCSEYIQRIRLYRSMIISPTMSDDARVFLDETIKTCFYKGAPTALHQMLQGFEVANPGNSDLQTLLSTAERFDNIYNFRPDSTSSSLPTTSLQSAQTIATAPTFSQPDPYAMEVDHIALPQVLINAIVQEVDRQNNNHQRNQYHGSNNQRGSRPNGNQHQWGRNNNNNNNNNNDWAHLPKLTPAERQYLIDNGGCFKCRKLGHLSYENRCPPRGRGMNHIATNVGAPFYGQSGNAPSGQA